MLNSLTKLNQQSTIKYNHSTKFEFKTNQTLTMETILIIAKKEMFSDSSRNYTRNKDRKFKNPFFDISFNHIYNIYIYNFHTLLLLKI